MEILLFATLLHGTSASLTLLNVPDCGLLQAAGRIIGGRAATKHQAPWFAQITFDGYFCGGAFITPRHVLTAAHCGTQGKFMYNPKRFFDFLQVRIGSAKPRKMSAYRPASFVRHPRFNGEYFLNDIMIIDMGREIKAKGLRPICLTSHREKNLTWEGSMSAIFGLGKVSAHPHRNAPRLMVTLQKVLSNEKCEAHPKLNQFRYDSKQHMCAYLSITKQGRTDACDGDSGGPLTVIRQLKDRSTRQFAVGIVSYGFDCAMRNTPGVYTRISYYQTFILETLKLMGGSQYIQK